MTTDDPITRPLETGSGVREKVSQAASQVKSTAADFGRSAAEGIDKNLNSAAGALEKTASSLRERVGEGGGKVTDFARTAADKMEGTARYFREHHSRDMVQDLEQMVRKNPGASLMAALGVGFLIGMSMKRDRY